MDSLPEELVLHIVRRVAQRSFRDLGPLIMVSKSTKDLVFKPEVLAVADLTEFVLNSSMANKDSIYRPFFSSCLANGNHNTNELEGLHILCPRRSIG